MSITIDSTVFNIPIRTLRRKADMLYKYAERTEDGVLHSELIGVYFNYELQAGMSANDVDDYAALWLKVTEPVSSHTIVMPDESGTVTFSCYFANISDSVIKTGATNYFKELTFSVIATSPARTP